MLPRLCGSALSRTSLLFVLGLAAPGLAAQGSPQFRPWIYTDGTTASPGQLVWDNHITFEDNSLTERVLSLELLDMQGLTGQAPGRPEMILFNRAHYSPPEGVAAPQGRRLNLGSIQHRGVQFYVNYSGVPIGSTGDYYKEGTFFIAHIANLDQPDPEIPQVLPDSGDLTISATGGAFGIWGSAVQQKSFIPPYIQTLDQYGGLDPTNVVNALYVTAGVIYATSEFLPSDQEAAVAAGTDRFFVKEGLGWHARDDLVPLAVREGHSSGVAFGDLTGDGYMDLYVGKSGDRFAGAPNVLLVGGSGDFEDRSALQLPPNISDATTDVAVADLNVDGNLDLVVANRRPLDNPMLAPTTVSDDYALMNNGFGNFITGRVVLDNTKTDTRSVAVGNLDGLAEAVSPSDRPEIVFGNAGDDGYGTELDPPNHQPLRIYSFGVHSYAEKLSDYMTPTQEKINTASLTRQVMLVDLMGSKDVPSAAFRPDGYLDLVIVNHREHLKTKNFNPAAGAPPYVNGSNVRFMRNKMGDPLPAKGLLNTSAATKDPWSRTAALSNFLRKDESPAAPTLDLFVAAGNRFHGEITYLYDDLGVGTNDSPWDIDFHDSQTYDLKPGAEHGYGLDFADYNGDGILDAMALSRSYNFLVHGIGLWAGAGSWHQDFAPTLSNRRGQLIPQGMEDGVFADFDRDGDLDAVLASQVTGGQEESPDTIVLKNVGDIEFEHAKKDWVGLQGAKVDVRVNILGRTSPFRARIADRAVAGDLDNDGDVDAIVRLFAVNQPGTQYVPLLTNSVFGGTPIANMSAGWRYLRNVIGESADPDPLVWFRDEAPTRMRDTTGAFSPTWNRRLGMDLLLDADNNGCLDLLSTFGVVVQEGPYVLGSNDVENIEQARDLLFLNGVDGTPPGVLTEVAREVVAMTPGGLGIPVLPPSPPDVIGSLPEEAAKPDDYNAIAGSFFAAGGDIDNDGDVDLFITHNEGGGGQTTNYPSLMINQRDQYSSLSLPWPTFFSDQWDAHVDPLNDIIQTPDLVEPGEPGQPNIFYADMDASWSGGFLDFDADGDNDLVYIVTDDLPRFLRNTGHDGNGDADYTDAGDIVPGHFEDVTAAVLSESSAYKFTTDGNDFQVVDLDADGDLDFAVYPFSDKATLWVNPLVNTGRPAVAEIWPRVGSRQRTTLTMYGANLGQVGQVELRFAGGQTLLLSGSAVQPLGPKKLKVILPMNSPVGLARVRVALNVAPFPVWSTQYQGYYVLDL